ncbi:MAG: amidase [Deltaproteobacteria bacterium]|nr:amidase [Deltaproteobacteria bacterium]
MIWNGFTPGNDARCVHYLREEGGVILGKTVTAEFAVHFPGPTVNPHNYEHTPGASSSGSAAAVASCMVPLALGSQTGGSTIRPASYCGVFGFKPTFGMIPRTGVLKTVNLLDHVTVFARTLEDTQLAFECTRVKGHNFPLIDSILDNPWLQKNRPPWRIAFVRTHLWNQWTPYARRAMEAFVQRLSECKGVLVSDAALPSEFEEAHEIHRVIYEKALSYYYATEYTNHRALLSDIFREMIERGRKISKADYVEAIGKQVYLSDKLEQFFNTYDGIVTLSTAGEAGKGLDARDTVDSCLIWTLCGAPAINVPLFKGPKKLPFGAQVIFRKYRDHSLFSFLLELKKQGLIQYPLGNQRSRHLSD